MVILLEFDYCIDKLGSIYCDLTSSTGVWVRISYFTGKDVESLDCKLYRQRRDRLLFPLSIPHRCCHQQFICSQPLTCLYNTLGITRETED